MSVYLTDDVLDRLDTLVQILPDAQNRSRLIASFVDMQLALLTNPEESWSMVMMNMIDLITDEAMAEIESWRVPSLDPDTETKGTA